MNLCIQLIFVDALKIELNNKELYLFSEFLSFFVTSNCSIINRICCIRTNQSHDCNRSIISIIIVFFSNQIRCKF